VNTTENSALDSSSTTIPAASEGQTEGPFANVSSVVALLLALFTWAASIVLLFLPQVIALPYILTHYRGQQPRIEELLADKTLVIILIAGILPVHLITLAIAWAVVTRLGKVPVTEALRWGWGHHIGVFKSVLLGVLLFGAAWLLVLAFGGKETELERIINSSRAAALLVAFMAVATAPLVEEIIYRGILFPAWQRLTGSVAAVVIVTLMFAIPHVPQYWPNLAVIFSILMLSAALTIVRARTSRLVPCYVIHLAFNGIQALLILIEPYLRALSNHSEPQAAPAILHSLKIFL
jgi:membrane protease YdiL (CAAX protease family)